MFDLEVAKRVDVIGLVFKCVVCRVYRHFDIGWIVTFFEALKH